MTREDMAYYAGLFDGEGCVMISSPGRSSGAKRSRLYVAIANTKMRELRRMYRDFGNRGCFKIVSPGGRRRPFATIWWGGTAGAQVLRTMLPYLRMNKRRALLGIRFQEFKESHVSPRGQHANKPENISVMNKLILKDQKYKSAMKRLTDYQGKAPR